MAEKALRSDIPVCRWPGGWEGNLRHPVIDNITINKSGTHILLVHRAGSEIAGDLWALIGGYVDPDTTVAETVAAETAQEAHQRIGRLALFRIVDDPRRPDETAQNVSFVFVNEIDDPEEYGEYLVDDPDGGVDRAKWFPIGNLPPKEQMAFDHHQILAAFQADPTTYPMSIFLSTSTL